jgi:GNAT superfamily N-acetyltransferase
VDAAGGAAAWHGEIRRAGDGDAGGVAALAAELALSFKFSADQFRVSYRALLTSDGACLLLAVDGREYAGYLLGFRHLTFYANGPVAWVEEIVVRGRDRRRGIGRMLMEAFEGWAALTEDARWSRWRPGARPRSTVTWATRNPPPISAS